MIIDLHELHHLADPSHPYAHYYRMLPPRYYSSCGLIEREAIFTCSCLIPPPELPYHNVGMSLGSVTDYIRATFLLDIDASTLELRFSDLDGDIFQVTRQTNILELLDKERPM